jgi:YesN/AraC family two-component response regulator
MDDYISKPLNVKQLSETIARVMCQVPEEEGGAGLERPAYNRDMERLNALARKDR